MLVHVHKKKQSQEQFQLQLSLERQLFIKLTLPRFAEVQTE